MSWLAWAGLVAATLAIFALGDFVLCGGRYCERFGRR